MALSKLNHLGSQILNIPILVLAKHARYLRRQVYDMTKSLQAHEVIDLDSFRLAHSVHVVAGEVDQHDVLRAILLRIQ